MIRLWNVGVAAGLCLLLAACGGGGGDSVASGSGTVVTLSADARLDVGAVEHNAKTFQLRAHISNVQPGQEIWIGVRSDASTVSLFSDVRFLYVDPSGQMQFDVDLRNDLLVGVQQEVLEIRICADAQCQKVLAGPVAVRIVVDVQPNIGIAPLIELSRSGSDPAPTVDVPISVPAAAGAIVLSPNLPGSDPIGVELVGGHLHLTTTQVRAGTYELEVNLASTSRAEYSARAMIRYTVLPPAGGERAMSIVADGPLALTATDGQVFRRRLTVTKASWSNGPVSAEPMNMWPVSPAILSIVKVSELEFDLVVDTRGAPAGPYSGLLVFSGPPQVGITPVNVSVQVDTAVRLDAPPGLVLNATTQPAEAQWSTPVAMVDGSRVNWSATVSAPWLRLVRGSGVTGADSLAVAVDLQQALRYPGRQFAWIDVTVDRPGVLPQRLVYNLVNELPAITVSSPGALAGSSGRIFLGGALLSRNDLVESGLLKVTGGTLRRTTYVADPRYAGSFYTVALDVDGLTPGVPVTVSIDTPVLRTAVTLPVNAATAPAAGRTALGYGLRRPATWSERERAWFFAGGDRVYRYGLAGAAWALASVSLPGVIDVDPSSEEGVLLALARDNALRGLDPATLASRWQAALLDVGSFGMPDPRMSVLHKAMAHNADGSVFVAVGQDGVDRGGVQQLGFDWLNPGASFGWQTGNYGGGAAPGNVALGIAASAGHETHVMSLGTAKDFNSRYLYRASTRGLSPAASATAAGRTPMGYAITGDGLFGLVYSVLLTGSGATQLASAPQVQVIDLRGAPMAPTVLATLSMSAAVGCGTPREAGETCTHDAALAVDPQSRMVLVLGPRGAAVVPLPDAVRRSFATAAARSLGRSAPLKLAWPASPNRP